MKKDEKKKCGKHNHGPTSFWMHDCDMIFKEIGIKKGCTFLDLGCGLGEYSLKASSVVGKDGHVFAFDRSKELIDNLKEKVSDLGIKNITSKVSDIIKPFSLSDNSIDVSLIATVLHDTDFKKWGRMVFKEVYRILKQGGRLGVIECKKETTPYGPPIDMRISESDIRNAVDKADFNERGFFDLGNNYLIVFTKK